MAKTWYAGHENAYRRNKERGYPGWDSSEEDYEEFKRVIEDTLSRGTAPRSGRLLEIGCGAGNMTPWLVYTGYDAYGVDISPTAVAWATERAESHGVKAEFIVGDVCELSAYEDAFFDFVLDKHCLHCIIGDDRRAVLRSVRRVLKPRGYFLVLTMCGPVDPQAFEGFDPESRCTIHGGIASRYIGMPADIVREIEDSGFKVVRWEVQPDVEVSGLVVEAVKDQ